MSISKDSESMGYIKDKEHLINYINKALRESTFTFEKDALPTADFVIENIYDKGLADRLAWEVKKDATIVIEENLLEFIGSEKIRDGNKKHSVDYGYEEKHDRSTDDYENVEKSIECVPGVYIFENSKGGALYVGTSNDLRSRIRGSSSRLSKYKNAVWLSVYECKTSSDAALLEVYFICKLKPPLNGTSKYDDSLTIKLQIIPDKKFRIKMFNPLRKKKVEHGKTV
jgi:GIY-YIG catalytic domain-containing protein